MFQQPFYPPITYLVYADVRSGSSLLCEALKNTHIAGRPEEYFWHSPENDSFYQDYNPADYTQYIRHVIHATATPNGVFGAKMMGGYLHSFIERIHQTPTYAAMSPAALLSSLFPNLKPIWITRRNKIRQAVSWWLAIQTNQWSSQQAINPQQPPTYNFQAIDHLVQELIIREAAVQEHFTQCHLKPFVLICEDFHDAYQETTHAVLNYLGLPSDLPINQPLLQKQATPLSEEWVQRYRHEKQSPWQTHFW